jgi:hypothetical protein
MYACRKVETLLKTDAEIRQAVEHLQQRWSACR